ncbi:MAG: hypothetical protein RR937_06130 [Ruthenibacterium sp.]
MLILFAANVMMHSFFVGAPLSLQFANFLLVNIRIFPVKLQIGAVPTLTDLHKTALTRFTKEEYRADSILASMNGSAKFSKRGSLLRMQPLHILPHLEMHSRISPF